MAEKYSRPASGFRFKMGGMKTNAQPDAIASDKYQLLLNARAYSDDEIRCRPGTTQLFTTGSGVPIRNIGSFAQGRGQIRYLATSGGNVYLDTGAAIESGVFDATQIQAMVPYRPNQSVVPWQYVGDSTNYRKYSLPASGVVTAAKAGIAEPQTPVDASLNGAFSNQIGRPAGTPTSATFGTGSALSSANRNGGSVIAAIADPANANLWYFVPSFATGSFFNRFQFIIVNTQLYEVIDVFASGQPASIQSIYYFTGSTGKCVIVPGNLAIGSGNIETPLSEFSAIPNLRRGSIVLIGAEYCLVTGVAKGQNGQISFETSTVSTHTTADTVTPQRTVAVNAASVVTSQAITGTAYTVTVGTGVGGFNLTGLAGTAWTFNLNYLQSDDYFHFSVNVDTLANLTEMKILFDIGDGSFTQNFLYYAVRPADIQQGVQNVLTQLGVAQLAEQRATIDEETRATHAASSDQSVAGSGQWSEIFVPIRELIRVGGDQTATLMNMNSVQVLFNCSGTIHAQVSSISMRGGYQLDTGETGAPYRYRIRPRSSLTGAKGNPSPDMRYGVSPRRDQVIVYLPGSYSDTQADFWDVFRLGGVLTNWTFVGTCPIGTTQFIDIYDDTTIQNSEQLDFDNLEPWPSIDNPFFGTASVTGTTAVVTPAAGSGNFIAQYLPGNKVVIGQNVYTLWTRPTRISLGPPSTWLMQFQESAGVASAGTVIRVYEPTFANNHLPFIWGPSDVGGVIFGAGDTLRPGTVSFTKNFNPDSVPDSYNVELCPPSEPIIGGVYADGISYAFSSNRVFPMRPSFGSENQWSPLPTSGPGLASPFGIATNGRIVWYVSPYGIQQLGRGSITDADLSNIFPADGSPPLKAQILGTFYPPDFTKANTFRLAHCNGYLYFAFIDLNGGQQTLVYDVKRSAWSVDQNSPRLVTYLNVIQPQTSSSGGAATLPVQMVMGDASGVVYEFTEQASDFGGAITCRVVTSEWTAGDERAPKQWGDCSVAALPPVTPRAWTIVPISGGVDQAQSLTINGTSRQTGVLSLGNTQLFSMGIDATATYGGGGTTVPVIYIWQPSYLAQPVVEAARFTDWDDAGIVGNKFWQGFILEANTNSLNKSLTVRDADNLNSHSYTPSPVNFVSQAEQVFSFNQPFVAHSVRIEPGDSVPWQLWGVRWVAVPYPETCETWYTEGVTHGLLGFQHIYLINLAYRASLPVTLTLSTDQGPAPVITFPATGAGLAPVKTIIKSPFNKFKVVSYQLVSSAPFYLWRDLCETWVKSWGSTGPYSRVNPFGGGSRMAAEV